MPTFTVLYTRPEQDAEAFLEEYRTDHLAITERFPNMSHSSTTVFDSTPRGGDPAYYVMFKGVWDADEEFREAMRDASLMEASKHAMGMLQKYGNSAEMMVGAEVG